MQGLTRRTLSADGEAMPNWFVLCCQSRRELAVHAELQEHGLTSMVPMEHVIVHPSRHSKRRELRSRPLLYGYIFLETDELPWQEIKDIPGVRGFLGNEDEPYALRPADVERLLALSSVVAPDDDPDRPLRPGDMALIVSGPYAGNTIKVKDIVGADAKWTTQMFGAMRTVRTPLTALKAA
jgi:transcription antitermination factor NusG